MENVSMKSRNWSASSSTAPLVVPAPFLLSRTRCAERYVQFLNVSISPTLLANS